MTSIENWEAGPGSYNISNELGALSQVYINPPRQTMNKGKKDPGTFVSNAQSKEWLGTCSPSVGKYSPNTSLLYKSVSASKFGSEKRKDYFLTGRDRSPGPIYTFPDLSARTCSFGKGQKVTLQKLEEIPSPSSYNPTTIHTKIPVKIKGYISDKVYSKNFEKYYRGQVGPGPASYLPLEPLKKGCILPKAQRNFNCNHHIDSTATPGPGTYNSTQPLTLKKSIGFGSKRNLDIRACNFNIDSNSYELFK